MDTLKAIVIGLGKQSLDDHLLALLGNPNVKVVGVTDADNGALLRFRLTFPELGNVMAVTDLEQLLDATKPDFAVVAVPHHMYFQIVEVLCRRGIPFLKEKPLARSLEEARRLFEIPNFTSLAFVATQRRFSGLYSEAWQGLMEIGRPYLFQGTYKLSIANPHEGWRGQRELAGGGCLIDMGYHLVDQLLWWFDGPPAHFSASVSCLAIQGADYTAEDSATVQFQYDNGMHGTLLISRRAGAKKEEYEIYGTDGHIVGSKKGATIYASDGSVIRELLPDPDDDMIAAQLRFFISRVVQGLSFEDTLADHMENMQFIDACYQDAGVSH